MRVAIVGASGETGRHLVRECLATGHEVVGVCREPSVPKLGELATRITVVPGLTSDREVIRKAVQGCDGVITIIVAPGRNSTYATDTVRAVLEEAKAARLVFAGSVGASRLLAGESHSLRVRMMLTVLGGIAAALGVANISNMLAATDRIYASPGRWTVVRAPWLTEGESQGLPVLGSLRDKSAGARAIRRVDFAKFMVAALEDDSLVRQAPVIARAAGA